MSMFFFRRLDVSSASPGFWVMIPLGLVHLILTILGVVYFDQDPGILRIPNGTKRVKMMNTR